MTAPGTRTTRSPPTGFTLVELLMATVITGLAVSASSWAVSHAVTSRHALDEEPYTASLLAREIYECAEGLDRTPTGQVGVTSGAHLVALDGLIGAEFSPPIMADGTADAALAEWTQRVSLEVFPLGDLSAATGEEAWRGLDRHDDRMYRLSVTVLKRRVEVDTYHWWLAP